ncbi:MAG: NnrS family protein, partial [Thermomonas sp.]
MFFIGASNLLLAMAWWAMWLVDARWQLFGLRQPTPYAGWLHAFVMQYQMLPSFFFGFLLTVFARWMGLPEIDRWRYLPVGLGIFGGQLAT